MIKDLEKFAKRMTLAGGIDLAENLFTLREEMDDAQSDMQELESQLETWTDEDTERESKAEAREEIEQILDTLIEKLRDIAVAINE